MSKKRIINSIADLNARHQIVAEMAAYHPIKEIAQKAGLSESMVRHLLDKGVEPRSLFNRIEALKDKRTNTDLAIWVDKSNASILNNIKELDSRVQSMRKYSIRGSGACAYDDAVEVQHRLEIILNDPRCANNKTINNECLTLYYAVLIEKTGLAGYQYEPEKSSLISKEVEQIFQKYSKGESESVPGMLVNLAKFMYYYGRKEYSEVVLYSDLFIQQMPSLGSMLTPFWRFIPQRFNIVGLGKTGRVEEAQSKYKLLSHELEKTDCEYIHFLGKELEVRLHAFAGSYHALRLLQDLPLIDKYSHLPLLTSRTHLEVMYHLGINDVQAVEQYAKQAEQLTGYSKWYAKQSLEYVNKLPPSR